MEPLLHLETTAGWRAVLAAGGIDPPTGGFVHLSTPAQVAYPAGYLYAGRDDVVLLVLDPERLDGVRFEDGDPPHPQGWQFPHAYARVPASAVLATMPYRPRADGGFDPPGRLPVTVAERAARVDPAIRRRAAGEELPVTGGVAIRSPGFERRWSANHLQVTGPATAAEVDADADRVLGGWGLPYRVAYLYGEHLARTARGLAERGWTVDAEVTMAARPTPGAAPRVEQIDLGGLLPLWTATRRTRYPDIDDAEVRQMLDGHAAEAAVTDVRFLAVREGGEPVAATVLKIDGATASFGPLDTLAASRGRGHGNALVTAALELARQAGCDVVALDALAEDWPRRWYARRGFAVVGRSWAAHRPA
ncbi:GNAT family N-acetyltransferase [Pseudonocardia sp.]|uniref:GNAT family N-acetyltransferase n=1 Tax=Pseudonocardia sp. TaxID=60912 RepID=UPI003D12AA6F